MRQINVGTQKHTKVMCVDTPGAGGSCHKYMVSCLDDLNSVCATINFQNGPIKEVGVNGCHNEDLIAIVIDRLQGFQSGEYGCQDNSLALAKLKDALLCLHRRTYERESRGVEGTNKV